ncbi:hypothetical protein STEG23_017144, partial [Scotinomys teguina]
DYLPRNGTSHSELCPPTSINSQDNLTQLCPQPQSDLSNSTIKVLSSQLTL